MTRVLNDSKNIVGKNVFIREDSFVIAGRTSFWEEQILNLIMQNFLYNKTMTCHWMVTGEADKGSQ